MVYNRCKNIREEVVRYNIAIVPAVVVHLLPHRGFHGAIVEIAHSLVFLLGIDSLQLSQERLSFDAIWVGVRG
jgi:hypothetical protein